MNTTFPGYIRRTYSTPNAPDVTFKLTAKWDYLSEDGNILIGHVARYEDSNGSGRKQYLPYFDVTPGGGLRAGYTNADLRPLFGLPSLANAGPVIITEGEKDAATLHQLGFAAVTSPGGAKSAAKADWTQLTRSAQFKNRPAILWRDADAAGIGYAQAVAQELSRHGVPAPTCLVYGKNGAGATDFVQEHLRGWDGVSPLQPASKIPALRAAVEEYLAQAGPLDAPKPQPSPGAKRSSAARPISEGDKVLLEQAAKGMVPVCTEYDVAPSGALTRFIYNSEGEGKPVPVADFSITIESEVIRDDGQSTSRDLRVSGRRNDRSLPTFQVPAARFADMDWVAEAWGAGCRILPGRLNRDYLADAARLLSALGGDIPASKEYVHTGWTRLTDGSRVFLTAQACIGASGALPGLIVDLRQGLERYALPAPPIDPAARLEAARASLRVLEIADRGVSIPLLAAAFLAPLANDLQSDFGLWLEAASEAGKTSLTAAVGAHFGPGLDRHHVLASCRSTYASIEGRVFRAKDVFGIVDDYYPAASHREQQGMEQVVSMLVRGIGNRDGRSRSNANLQERPSRLPRGMLVFTAEMGLKGHSEQNRLLVVPLARKAVNWAALTVTQQEGASGRLADSMALYIQHLAAISDFGPYQSEFESYRAQAREQGLTGRAPDQVAYLSVGFAEYARHLARLGAIAAPDAATLAAEGFAVLCGIAQAHRAQVQAVTPAQLAIEAVREALALGQAHLLDKVSGRPKGCQTNGWGETYPQGVAIGWIDTTRDMVYLMPGATYELVVKKTGMTLSDRALWQRWHAAGWLCDGEGGRHTVRVSVAKAGQQRGLPLKLEALGQVSPKLVTIEPEPSEDSQKVLLEACP